MSMVPERDPEGSTVPGKATVISFEAGRALSLREKTELDELGIKLGPLCLFI